MKNVKPTKIPREEPVIEKKSLFRLGMEEREFRTLVLRELRQVSRDTISAWRCLENGRMTPLKRVNMLFGLTDTVVKCGERRIAERLFSPMALEKAIKNGTELTNLMGKEVIVSTMFDKMSDKDVPDDIC